MPGSAAGFRAQTHERGGEPLTYRQRPKPVGYEVAYRLAADTLTVDTMHKVDTVRLGAVTEMRFAYDPQNFAHHAFRTTLKLTSGQKLSFTNLSWKGLVDCTRQDEAYREFALALVAAVVTASPACRLIAGKPPLIWWLMSAVTALTGLGLVAFIIRALTLGAMSAAAVGFAIAGLTAWQMGPLVRRNRPRLLSPHAIPPDVLP